MKGNDMEQMRSYAWAQEKVAKTTGMTSEQRDGAACQRRLRQMEARRAKQAARTAKAISNGDGITSDGGDEYQSAVQAAAGGLTQTACEG